MMPNMPEKNYNEFLRRHSFWGLLTLSSCYNLLSLNYLYVGRTGFPLYKLTWIYPVCNYSLSNMREFNTLCDSVGVVVEIIYYICCICCTRCICSLYKNLTGSVVRLTISDVIFGVSFVTGLVVNLRNAVSMRFDLGMGIKAFYMTRSVVSLSDSQTLGYVILLRYVWPFDTVYDSYT